MSSSYRSGIYYYNDNQKDLAEKTKAAYQTELSKKGHGSITTEVIPAPDFYYAEDYHQEYLHKNPGGYCGRGGTGGACPRGVGVDSKPKADL